MMAIGTLHVHEFGTNLDGFIHYLGTARTQSITWMDTADVYGWYQDGRGRSNDLIGEAFARRPDLQDHFRIVAKCGIRLEGGYHIDLSPEWIQSSVDRFLSIFRKPYIDILMIHNPTDTLSRRIKIEGMCTNPEGQRTSQKIGLKFYILYFMSRRLFEWYQRVPRGMRERMEDPLYGMIGVLAGTAGMFSGLQKGWESANAYQHGYLWRPIVWTPCYTIMYGVAGLYWPQCLAVSVALDMYRSLSASPTSSDG